MLADPITRENAADFARRATISRENNRRARKLALEQTHAKPEIEPEINRIVKAMKKLSVTSDDYAALVQHLDKLWNKAFPTQGSVKSRGNRDRQPMAQPIAEEASRPVETPQEPNL